MSFDRALEWSVLGRLPGTAVMVFDRETRIVAAGGELLWAAGYDPGQMEGRTILDLLGPDRWAVYEPHYRAALAGEDSTIEAPAIDGPQIFRSSFSPRRDDQGTIIGGVIVSHDVTEAREAQRALEESEREFRRLAEDVTDVISRVAVDGTCLYVSPACRAMLGYEPEELIGQSMLHLIHPGDALVLAERTRMPGRTTETLRMLHKDGSVVHTESAIRREQDVQTGETIQLFVVTRDIGDRLAAADLRARWEQAFECDPRGIAVADPDTGIMLSVNPAYADMHGGRPEDFVGHPLREDPEHERLDGSRFPVGIETIVTRGDDGRPRYRIVWFEDLSERRATELAHRDATNMFEAAFEDAPWGVALIGLDGIFLRVNPELCNMLGRTYLDIVGQTSKGFTHPDDLEITAAAYEHLRTKHVPLAVEKRYVRPDGEIVWAATRGTTIRDETGQPRYIISHFRDITAAKNLELERELANRRFETAFADAPIGMALVGLEGNFIKVNRALQAITGYSEEQLLGLTFQEITHPDDLDADLRNVEQLLAGEIERYRMEKRYYTARGHVIWIELAVSLVRDARGEPDYFISQIEDISARKRMETELQRLADQDSMTGLWNRRRFQDDLHRQVSRCKRYGERAALIVLDLNGFKPVNDRHGHQAGDDMLVAVARALSSRVRESDTVGRLGGDEFAVLLVNIAPDQAVAICEDLRRAVAEATITAGEKTLSVTASTGLVLLDEHTESDDAAMLRADAAMYDAKVASAAGRKSDPAAN